ncbi:hypothetical protein NDU88_005595 [Pleurodeles waltl]|uniref:Uncharacterized protein n=1 Tax=Pleurodeles waltl TaxID=8319 RepID=A0AAV7N1Q5_PLEWA|nr:hypothetical protein NDU88_005595 [Pleurodeles waltl]
MLGARRARSPPLARAGFTVRCGDRKYGISKGHVTRRRSKAAGKRSSQQRRAMPAECNNPQKSTHTKAMKLTVHETQRSEDTVDTRARQLLSARGRAAASEMTGCRTCVWRSQ